MVLVVGSLCCPYGTHFGSTNRVFLYNTPNSASGSISRNILSLRSALIQGYFPHITGCRCVCVSISGADSRRDIKAHVHGIRDTIERMNHTFIMAHVRSDLFAAVRGLGGCSGKGREEGVGLSSSTRSNGEEASLSEVDGWGFDLVGRIEQERSYEECGCA